MQTGEIAFGRFEIERRAGAGAVGIVYRARDMESGRSVALKVLTGASDREGARFAREASVLANLSHPGIVRYVAHGSSEDELYLAMEWLDGEDLGARLEREPVSMAESLDIAAQVADALSAAHARGVLHRDIKPRNIFLLEAADGSLRVKLLDFGIARITQDAAGVTLTGAMLGTPGYMAPEQAQGTRDVSAHADVFSLGCLMFRCITGRPAISGDNVMAVLAKTILDAPPRIRDVMPEVSSAVDDLVARMLSKDPDDRPADAGAVAHELRALGDPSALLQTGSVRPYVHGALTQSERRVVCVLLARRVDPDDWPSASALADTGPRARGVAELVDSYGGRLDQLADGSLLVSLSGKMAAPDQAATAARCALSLHATLPNMPVVLATGGQVLGQAGQAPRVGKLIDRGVHLLGLGGVDGVRIDDTTAGLLDVRFQVASDGRGLFVQKEREIIEATRTLLGRPYPCIGRAKELNYLDALLDECIDEPIARTVLLTGEAGRGKSRIRYEFIKRVREECPSVEILVGRGDTLSAGSPFGMIAPAIRRAAGIMEDDSADVKRIRLRARVARHVIDNDEIDRIAHFLGELVGVPFSDGSDPALRAARRDPMLMGDAMTRALQDFIGFEVDVQPVIFVLEDLHWGDLPSIRIIDAVMRHLADKSFFVFALARPEVHTQFPGLWSDRDFTELRLSALTPRASLRLAKEVLGDRVDDEALSTIVERSGGNAFYLEELMRAVAAGADHTVLPPTVLAMVQARLDSMGSEAKRLLRAASIFGQSFWQGGVAALLGGDVQADSVREWLAELVEREVIAARGRSTYGDEPMFIFRHALLRDAAYSMLTDGDRKLGHELAGDWLMSVGERDAIVLAEHFDRGGVPARAVSWYRRAAEHALEGNDFGAAVARAERGIACGADGEEFGALHLVLAEARKWRGDLEEATQHLKEAVERLDFGSTIWFRAVGEGIAIAGQRADAEWLLALIEEASSVTSAEGLAAAQIICLCRGGQCLFQVGRNEVAEHLVSQVEELAGDLAEQEPAAVARIHQLRATRELSAGRAAFEPFEAALEGFERAGDARNAALTRVNVGVAYAEVGAYERAEPTLRHAYRSAVQMGLSNVAAWAQNNLGNVYLRLGRFGSAREVLQKAIATGKEHKNRRLEVASRLYLADVGLASGDFSVAEREARLALELATDIPPLSCLTLAVLSRALLAQDPAAHPEPSAGQTEALEIAERSTSLLERLDAVEGDAYVRLTHAEALAAVGNRPAARKAILAAKAKVLARANSIPDETLRQSFLTHVWEHERTLSLVDAWSAGAPPPHD